MDEVTLPPLPQPKLRFDILMSPTGERLDYSADDMRAYAQQAASAAVLQERARAEQDAMRYRWLRDLALEFSGGRVHVVEFIAPIAYGDCIDAAIDAAIRTDKEGA